MPVLSKAEVQQKLKEMQGWSLEDKVIRRKFTLKSFMPVIALVNKIAEAAESANHHPDMTINYNVLAISLSTHSEGGVTEKDFALAKRIDEIASQSS